MQTKSMAFSRSLRPLPLQSGWERSTDLEITYSLLAQTFSVRHLHAEREAPCPPPLVRMEGARD